MCGRSYARWVIYRAERWKEHMAVIGATCAVRPSHASGGPTRLPRTRFRVYGASATSLPASTMPDESSSPPPTETPEQQNDASTVAEQSPPVAPAAEDRSELVSRARAFLTSPQVQHEDLAAKRRFLIEKGLNDAEVEALLRDVVRTQSPCRGAASP